MFEAIANRKLNKVMEMLNEVIGRQNEYEKDYLKKDRDTGFL